MLLLKILNDEGVSDEELNNFKHRKAVRVVIFNDKNMIALVHAKINEYYELPGGGVEENESLEEGALREAKEEAGCDTEIVEEVGIVKEYFKDKNLINETFGFQSKVVGATHELSLNQDEINEGMHIVWVEVDEAIRLINSNKSESKFATPLQVKYTKVRDLTFLDKIKGNQ